MTKPESAAPLDHWTARLKQFQEYTVAHPHLVEAKDRLVAAVRESAPNSLILVIGPTGVGKSTLRGRVEQLLTSESLPEMESDPARIPVVSVEAVAPTSGSFNWRDHFKRMLSAMDEPLIERKRMLPCESESNAVFTPGPKAPGGEYYRAVEQALRYRRPGAVLIDEAQHLAKMSSGRRLLDQLDVIKSLANRTGTVHALFGTYDLLAFRNLSGQLSRRSIDVHFRRYRADNGDDRKAFMNVLRSFERQIPLAEPADLVANWEFLYERSIGCVGILKDWLVRTLSAILRRGSTSLTFRDLTVHALTVSQCEKILAEITEGETRLAESDGARSRFRLALGLSSVETVRETAKTAPLPQRGRPGQRRPTRDPIGVPQLAHAEIRTA
jgi:energy-coupling factor transporter ATP-binding protein EcfA2